MKLTFLKFILLLLCFCSIGFSETIILHYDTSKKYKEGAGESMVFVRDRNNPKSFIYENGPTYPWNNEKQTFTVLDEYIRKDEKSGDTKGFIILTGSSHYFIRIDLSENFWCDVFLPRADDKKGLTGDYGNITYVR